MAAMASRADLPGAVTVPAAVTGPGAEYLMWQMEF